MEWNWEINVHGNFEELHHYVKNELLNADETKKKLRELDKFELNGCGAEEITVAITDALIRYTEGIDNAIESQEENSIDENQNVRWVSQDRRLSISITEAMKYLINTLLFVIIDVIIVDREQIDREVVTTMVLSCVVQIMQYVHQNIHELSKKEMYVYTICLASSEWRYDKFFSETDALKMKKKYDRDCEKDGEVNVGDEEFIEMIDHFVEMDLIQKINKHVYKLKL